MCLVSFWLFFLWCTCLHLVHTVEEVVWSAGDAVTAHAQATVRALVSGVICPTAQKTPSMTGHTDLKDKCSLDKYKSYTYVNCTVTLPPKSLGTVRFILKEINVISYKCCSFECSFHQRFLKRCFLRSPARQAKKKKKTKLCARFSKSEVTK